MAQTTRRKSQETQCCSVSLLRYYLHIFNLVFLGTGLGVLGVGLWSVIDKHRYISLLTTATYPVTAYTLIATGGLVIFVSIIGCCAVAKENRFLLLIYTFLLLFIFVVEVMVGVLSYLYSEQVESELNLNLNTTFLDNYKIDDDKTFAIDDLQQKFKCCGAIRFEDWLHSKWLVNNTNVKNLVPDSCCKTPSTQCGRRDHPSNIYYSGCVYQLTDELKSHLGIISAVGLGISILQIIGVIFSCCLYVKLKDDTKRTLVPSK